MSENCKTITPEYKNLQNGGEQLFSNYHRCTFKLFKKKKKKFRENVAKPGHYVILHSKIMHYIKSQCVFFLKDALKNQCIYLNLFPTVSEKQ